CEGRPGGIQGVAPFGCKGRPGGIQGVVPFVVLHEENSSEEFSDNNESNEDSEDEEAMLSWRLQRILAKKKKFQSGRRYFKKNKDFKKLEVKDSKKGEPICYECQKPRHIKTECPKLKKLECRKKESSRKPRTFKKKAMAAAWGNSSDSNSESSSSIEEEEEANLAFMANTEENERFALVKTKLCGHKAVDVADLQKNGMGSIIAATDRLKWTKIATLSEVSYPDLVKAFYVCLKTEEDGTLTSMVKGTQIRDGKLDINQLNAFNRLLYFIVCQIVVPRSATFSTCTKADSDLMFWAIQTQEIKTAEIMIERMKFASAHVWDTKSKLNVSVTTLII
ncbi:hypothetical protein Taro_047024, partial [Colocasia esculenta]|nr:hypothetical protein [Colocasia esculenta]